MSDHAPPIEQRAPSRLPKWLRPRELEHEGTGRMRLIETTVLVLAAVLLAVATVDDVRLQTKINHRLIADLRTWRVHTGHDYHNLTVAQDMHEHTTREVVCGNTTPGAPKERIQICLVMTGPVSHGLRRVASGWYLPPRVEDLTGYRYGCFGPPAAGWPCPR